MMAREEESNTGPHYGSTFGFIYIFNLIVGTGALTMPKAFETAGWLLSSMLIVFLTFMSYITGTFMFESMAIANSIKRSSKEAEKAIENYSSVIPKSASKTSIPQNETLETDNELNQEIDQIRAINYEERPLMIHDQSASDEEINVKDDKDKIDLNKLFDIKTKFEMGEMAAMFFNKLGLYCFYVSMILYLYGDLAIYDAAVPKSLRDTACTFYYANSTGGNKSKTLSESDPCWSSIPSLSRMNAYRIFVVCFNLCIGPLVFYNAQKTKFLQLCTTLARWIAFITMIILASKRIHENSHSVPPQPIDTNLFNIKGVPNFFGVCIYAFMCHHSLPSIITPIKHKSKFKSIFMIAYICILIFYLLLSFTAVFAFGKKLDDFYPLNFEPQHSDDVKNHDGTFLTIIRYYLSLFPVFTISTSFPIIGITLRNNLISLYQLVSQSKQQQQQQQQQSSRFIFYFFPLITLIPPLIISLITHDLQLLVGITGSYAGVTIQYVFPALLVYFGRRESIRVFRQNYETKQPNKSPFTNRFWVYFVLLWAHVSVIFVTINHLVNKS